MSKGTTTIILLVIAVIVILASFMPKARKENPATPGPNAEAPAQR